jgi:MFS transporter, OFA family, oxalate/formate antiporter
MNRLGKREEFAAHWPVVIAAFVGIMMGAWSFPIYILGPLIKPLEAEFGWSRNGIVACTTFLAAGLTLGTPMFGKLADRFSVRTIAVTSMLMFAVCLVLVAWVAGRLWHLQVLYFLMGLLGAGSGGVTFTRAIGSRFEVARGIALGIALTGSGAASFAAPYLVNSLTQTAGWRWVCLVLAGLIVAVALPIVFFGLGGPSAVRAHRGQQSPQGAVTGASRAEAFRDGRFYVLFAAASLFGLFIGSLLVHLVPMLIDKGVTAARAAQIASINGIAIVVGRLCIGWLLDRFSAAHVGAGMFTLGAFGALVFVALGPASAMFTVAAIGLLLGAELDLLSYMTLKYFGVRHYGAIYGVLFSAYSLASMATPLVSAGLIGWGGYSALFSGAGLAFTTCGVLFLMLPWLARCRLEPAATR